MRRHGRSFRKVLGLLLRLSTLFCKSLFSLHGLLVRLIERALLEFTHAIAGKPPPDFLTYLSEVSSRHHVLDDLLILIDPRTDDPVSPFPFVDFIYLYLYFFCIPRLIVLFFCLCIFFYFSFTYLGCQYKGCHCQYSIGHFWIDLFTAVKSVW